ncbi:MAG: hypothetical protein M1540_00635 [Candidatus Bathyarchaeota archaeon]|nr:hypothetical protein [Candidatus Bathyarchaeota archaeon]
MNSAGNVLLGVGAFMIFLSIVFYFAGGASSHPWVTYDYRAQAPFLAVIGFILSAMGIVITFIDYRKTAVVRKKTRSRQKNQANSEILEASNHKVLL